MENKKIKKPLNNFYLYIFFSCDSCERLNRIIQGRSYNSDGKVAKIGRGSLSEGYKKKSFLNHTRSNLRLIACHHHIKTTTVKKTCLITIKKKIRNLHNKNLGQKTKKKRTMRKNSRLKKKNSPKIHTGMGMVAQKFIK